MRVLEQHTGMTAHQTLLLEMLKDIDIVCKRRRISYQLFAGTALGAVRHHGFIPWDDDVDIILQKLQKAYEAEHAFLRMGHLKLQQLII